MKRIFGLLVLGALLARGAGAQEAKAPWLLTFTHGPLDVHTVRYRDGSSKPLYYFTFKLENKSPSDAKLNLHIRAMVGSNPKKSKLHVALPHAHAEEGVRRIARADDLKNVQDINKMGTLPAGESVRGIAVLGRFNVEWDEATIDVSGLEPAARQCRVKKYGDAGFTLAHRAYLRHNAAVRKAAGDAEFKDIGVIIHHKVIWSMTYSRAGDEFGAHLDPIALEREGWDVVSDPGPKIVYELKPVFDGG